MAQVPLTARPEPWDVLVGSWSLGLVHLLKGEFGPAATALERAMACGLERDIPLWLAHIASSLGYAYALSGRMAPALDMFERVATRTSTERSVHVSRMLAYRGETYLMAGRPDAAMDASLESLHYARERKERACEAWAMRLLGTIASRRDRPDVAVAESHYRAARALAEELGMRPLVAHCHFGLGELYARIGKRLEARAELTVAADLYRAMGMTFWLPRAETALAGIAR
jgi:tetratricopeptide (TPR) repeat protein